METQKRLLDEILLSNNVDQLKDIHKNLERYKKFNDESIELNKTAFFLHETHLYLLSEVADRYVNFIDTYKINLDLFNNNNILSVNEEKLKSFDENIAYLTFHLKKVQKKRKDLTYCINDMFKELTLLNYDWSREFNNSKTVHIRGYEAVIEKDALKYAKKLKNFDKFICMLTYNCEDKLIKIKEMDIQSSTLLNNNKSSITHTNNKINNIYFIICEEDLVNLPLSTQLNYTKEEKINAASNLMKSVVMRCKAYSNKVTIIDFTTNLNFSKEMVDLFTNNINNRTMFDNTDKEVLDYFYIGQNRGVSILSAKLDNYYNLTDEVSEFLYTFGKDGTNN